MAAHICEGCGLLHDTPTEVGEPVEVQLARIAKEQAVEVAKINARLERDALDTAEMIAETEAEAEIGAAAAEAAVLGELLNAGDDQAPEPIIIDAPPIPDPEPEPDPTDDAAPPPAEHHEEDDDKPRKRGLGMW